jgi:hypothetical protein
VRAAELYAERAASGEARGRGLLLFIDPAQSAVRVEVGYRLEPILTDVAASRLLADFLAPRFRAGDTSAAIEASVEALVDELRPRLEIETPASEADDDASRGSSADADSALASNDVSSASLVRGSGTESVATSDARAPEDAASQWPSGGAGASLDLLRDVPDGAVDADIRARLLAIAVPQPDPRQARDLELALLHRGIYLQESALYDSAWRSAARPGSTSPSRLREIARQWDRPYELVVGDGRAVAYYADTAALGPTFLRREAEGWIIDGSEGARTVVYDYSNTRWYARDAGSPYLELLQRALALRRVSMAQGGAAWTLE